MFQASRTDPPVPARFVNAFCLFCPFCRQDVADELGRVSIVGERKYDAETVGQSVVVNKRLLPRPSLRERMVKCAAGRKARRGPREP